MRPAEKYQAETLHVAEVDILRRYGLIRADQYLDAIYLCRDAQYWTRWALRALLALGVAHLLAGIIFFFAYNWDSLSPVVKFAILQSGILFTVIVALIVKIDRAAGQALLIAASVLAGTLLAVTGQVYQTGADAYELFTLWALLIAPWVLGSRSAAHWFIWLIIAGLAFNQYAYQALIPVGTISVAEFSCLLTFVTAVILALRELTVRAGATWLKARWTRLILVFAGLAIVFMPAIRYPLDFMPLIEFALGSEAQIIAVLTFIVSVAALTFVYVRLLPDFGAIAIGTGFFAIFLMTIGARVLAELIGFDWNVASKILPSLGLLVLWCAALTAGTLKTLAIVRRYIRPEDADA